MGKLSTKQPKNCCNYGGGEMFGGRTIGHFLCVFAQRAVARGERGDGALCNDERSRNLSGHDEKD